MRKIVSLVITFGVITLASVAALISLNNQNNNNSDVRSTVNTVASTVAPTVVPTEVSTTVAPVLPVETIAPFVPVATTAPAAVETTPEEISSLDVSKKTIVTDDEGNFRQMMISYGDLKKVDYEEIIIENWNGVNLIVNNKGVVGEVFGREDKANNPKTTTKLVEVKNFFINGLIKSNRVEEGYALPNKEMEKYNLTNIMFVQIIGEENYRLVVAGNSRAGGGNGSNPDPTGTATPAETGTPAAPKETVTPDPGHNPTSTQTPATEGAPEDPTEKVSHEARHNKEATTAVEETPESPVLESSAEASAEKVEEINPTEATGDVPGAPI